MLSNIISIINFIFKYKFESLLLFCILFIVTFGIYCKFSKKKGSWSTDYFYPTKNHFEENLRLSSSSKGERECKKFLEFYFNEKFEKLRPNFLYNRGTYSNLELDMCNLELNLACEYNGKQHYEYTPYFHKNGIVDFKKQVQRDQLKIDVCRKLGINLIIVPYYISIDNISEYILDELIALGYNH